MLQQNGRAECFNCTIMDKAESMWHDVCLTNNWWNFTVEHTVHLYNHTYMGRLGMSPFKVMYGVAPDLSNLQVFGCSAYVFLPQEIRCNKLVPKSELMIHLGIEDGIKGFHFMCIHNNTIFYAPRALFNEDHFPKCKKTELKAVTHLPKPSKQAKSTPSIGAPPLLPFHPHDNLRWDWAPSAGPPAPVAAQPPPLPGPLGLQRGRPAFLHIPHGPASNPTQLLLEQTGFTPPHVIQLPWLSTKHVQGQSLPSLRFRRLSSPSDTTGPSWPFTRSHVQKQPLPTLSIKGNLCATSPAPLRCSSQIQSQTQLPRNVYGDRPPLKYCEIHNILHH